MKTLKFNTTIMCSNCLSKVSPKLNELEGIESWEVDLQSEQRVLTVKTENLSEEDIFKAVLKAGFIAKAQ